MMKDQVIKLTLLIFTHFIWLAHLTRQVIPIKITIYYHHVGKHRVLEHKRKDLEPQDNFLSLRGGQFLYPKIVRTLQASSSNNLILTINPTDLRQIT